MLTKLPRSIRTAVVAALLASPLCLTGCGGGGAKVGTVEGTVTVDGAPANSGTVVFQVDKASISGTIQPDGPYRAVAVPVGDAQVSVQSATAPSGMTTATVPGMGPAAGKPVPIPAKYGKPATSGLKFTVKGGTNKFPITLTK